MRSSLSTLLFVGLSLAQATGMAFACSYEEPRPFSDVLSEADSVAIVRIEEIRLKPQPHREITFAPEQVALVRVVETLIGRESRVQTVEFSRSWCGGHHLDVGEYYVLLSDGNQPDLTLAPGDNSIIYLFGEFDERAGSSSESSSVLLMHLRNYARGANFPKGSTPFPRTV